MSLSRRAAKSGPGPHHDRRWHRTRTAILDAGQTLFAKGAMEGVTIDDIVGTADIAKGSFYNHFDGKQELARTIFELVQGDCEFHIFVANKAIDDPAVRMARAFCVLLRYASDHPERLQALLNLSVRSTDHGSLLNTGVTGDLSAGIERGRFTGIDLEAGLLIVLGLMRITVGQAMMAGSPKPVQDYAVTMGAALLRALGVKESDTVTLATTASRDLLSTIGQGENKA